MRITHKSRFLKYRDETVITKSKLFARWTLPQLMVNHAENLGSTPAQVERDYQEIGALLVNNLGAKLTALLFPNNRPFFKINMSDLLRKHAEKEGKSTTDLNAGLARIEMDASQQLFLNASYNQLTIALKHLIITGNVLLYRNAKTHRTVAYGLQNFGIRRSGEGTMLDCVLREFTSFEGLEPKTQALIRAKAPHKYRPGNFDTSVELYTRIERVLNEHQRYVYVITQEVEDVPVGEKGIYPEHLCPYQAPTWSLLAGEHYGRGLVEDFGGGFAKLSDSSEALALYGISILKFVNLVQPGFGADVDELQGAETGEFVHGSKDAVSVYEPGDAQKVIAIRAEIDATMQNLSRAFMYTGNTRDAERVTAYELKQLALEADNTLGGVYSALAESMQVPMAHITVTEVEPGVLEGLITGDLVLQIMAGIPALGRAADIQNLIAACQEAAAIVPVLKQLDRRINVGKVMDLIYAGQSVDTSLLFNDEQQQKEIDAAEQQQAAGEAQLAQTQGLAEQAQQLQQLQ